MRRWREEFPTVPVIAVPTTYNHVTEDELQKAGVNLCIYANQLPAPQRLEIERYVYVICISLIMNS